MALTLFKPFVIGRLIETEVAYNVKHAEKVIEEKSKEVWDTLDEVIKGKYVLLNRAPTLHRLGIQAFRPVLIDGKAIRLHPLCCTAFNADFDGDQMAVHLPLTIEAQNEAETLMVTSKNMLNPSNGEPIVAPSQDMILGCYYLTKIDGTEAKYAFAGGDDASAAFENDIITLHTPIKMRINGKVMDTTYGRFLFNEILPPELQYVNETIGKNGAKKILSRSFDILGGEPTAFLADDIKNLGFKYATISGLTVSAFDMIIPDRKRMICSWRWRKNQRNPKGLLAWTYDWWRTLSPITPSMVSGQIQDRKGDEKELWSKESYLQPRRFRSSW
jgi:DNA-directed RNA polymerase subunit beta'